MVALPRLDPETVFCQTYARTGDLVGAVIASGIRDLGDPTFLPPLPIVGQALLDRPEIQAAVKAFRLVAASTDPAEITHRTIAESMDEVYRRAFQLDDMKACISARQLQANVLGLLEQKIHITTHKSIDDMTTDELRRIASKGMIDVTPTKVIDAGPEDNQPGPGGSRDTAPRVG